MNLNFLVNFNFTQIKIIYLPRLRLDLLFHWSSMSFWWAVQQNRITLTWQETRIEAADIGDTTFTVCDVQVDPPVTFKFTNSTVPIPTLRFRIRTDFSTGKIKFDIFFKMYTNDILSTGYLHLEFFTLAKFRPLIDLPRHIKHYCCWLFILGLSIIVHSNCLP